MRSLSYRELNARVDKLGNALLLRGLQAGDCLAVLSENNWRLTPAEMRPCIELVSPRLLFVSERFKTTLLDMAGGWFHMGDIFVRCEDGSLMYVDRAKYLIKSGGENIYPAEIERALLAHPRVVEAAAVRQQHARWGDVPVAFVALRHAAEAGEDELLAWCAERLARYKLLKSLRIVEQSEFPRNSTGKVMRHEIERRWVGAVSPQ